MNMAQLIFWIIVPCFLLGLFIYCAIKSKNEEYGNQIWETRLFFVGLLSTPYFIAVILLWLIDSGILFQISKIIIEFFSIEF